MNFSAREQQWTKKRERQPFPCGERLVPEQHWRGSQRPRNLHSHERYAADFPDDDHVGSELAEGSEELPDCRETATIKPLSIVLVSAS
jgi:hypothetical protein